MSCPQTFVSPVDVVGYRAASTSPLYLLFPDIGGFSGKVGGDPPIPSSGFGERYELPWRGPGWSPGRKSHFDSF